MLSTAAQPIVIFLLATFSVGGLLLACFYSRLAGDHQTSVRLDVIAAGRKPADRRVGSPEEKRRKQSVEGVLRDLEEKQRASTRKSPKPSLAIRMRQGGLSWSKNTYFALCVGAGLACFIVALSLFGLGLLAAAGFGIAGGLLLPHAIVNHKRNKRFKQFSAEFPNAVDVIVRGVKSGLPLGDCLKIIASEAQEPVKGEFKAIIEDHTMGMPLDEAVQRLPERLPVTEANFFGIVIAIQSRTGGSLSEALGNLAKVLRERKKMKAKIKSMSSEAKASAGIIGALPPVVGSLVYLTSPDYISLLFTTFPGNAILVGSGLWMLFGVLVMRKMINFDF